MHLTRTDLEERICHLERERDDALAERDRAREKAKTGGKMTAEFKARHERHMADWYAGAQIWMPVIERLKAAGHITEINVAVMHDDDFARVMVRALDTERTKLVQGAEQALTFLDEMGDDLAHTHAADVANKLCAALGGGNGQG